jgi:hypothetical protein
LTSIKDKYDFFTAFLFECCRGAEREIKIPRSRLRYISVVDGKKNEVKLRCYKVQHSIPHSVMTKPL